MVPPNYIVHQQLDEETDNRMSSDSQPDIQTEPQQLLNQTITLNRRVDSTINTSCMHDTHSTRWRIGCENCLLNWLKQTYIEERSLCSHHLRVADVDEMSTDCVKEDVQKVLLMELLK